MWFFLKFAVLLVGLGIAGFGALLALFGFDAPLWPWSGLIVLLFGLAIVYWIVPTIGPGSRVPSFRQLTATLPSFTRPSGGYRGASGRRLTRPGVVATLLILAVGGLLTLLAQPLFPQVWEDWIEGVQARVVKVQQALTEEDTEPSR